MSKLDQFLIHVIHAREAFVGIVVLDVEGVAPHVHAVDADELAGGLLDDGDALLPLDLEVALQLELLLQVLLADPQD